MTTRRDTGALVVAGVCLLSLLLTSPLAAVAEDTPEDPSSGTALYEKYCSSCHGLDGKGGTPFAELLRVAPPDLTRIAERHGGWFPDSLVREIIDGRFVAHGGREMPVWGQTLSQAKLIAITNHLYGIQERRPKSPN